MRQISGYAIVQMPTVLTSSYETGMKMHEKRWELLQHLWRTLEPRQRTTYRGISRFPLKLLPSIDPDVLGAFEATGCDVHTEYAARLRFLELLGEDSPEADYDEDLLPDVAAARDVFSCLESPTNYEIVQFAREPFREHNRRLGYDIGYWGGDHFSLISDAAVWPEWHPPDPDCFQQLAQRLKNVNEFFLFRSPADAELFRAWYRTQDWAETEFDGEFCIIQVNVP